MTSDTSAWQLTPLRGSSEVVRLSDAPLTIGRHPDNALPLEDEKSSRFHCVVEPWGEGFRVRDLGSRNGTKVNDVRVQEAVLNPGDVLRVGSHEFLVESSVERRTAQQAALSESKVEMAEAPGPGTPQGEALELNTGPSGASNAWKQELLEITEGLPPKGPLSGTVTMVQADGKPSPALASPADGPMACRLLLQLALKSRSTDLHIEPKPEHYHVRMRVDGQMIWIIDLPTRVGELVYGLIKTATNMRAAARDALQEGHFSAVFADRRVEYRVSFTSAVHGQKLVIRVLDSTGLPTTISEVGLAGYMVERVRRVCAQDHGMLLVAGPTGCGKTTTLYNALREIDRRARNVITIEDPVEYQLEGVTQIPIDESKGHTFGTLLRSVLRQDPDVILVGEIRDEETARTAMQASMTGHLVFSTVHAKDTISAVFRLLDLKVEPYLVANSLDLVLAQRLVRVLCDSCKRPVPVTSGQAIRLGKHLGECREFYVPTGCTRCLKTGFRGRRAIFELLEFNDELRDTVLKTPTIAAMKKIIDQGLFTTLPHFGWRMVAEGVTPLDEVDRVAGGG